MKGQGYRHWYLTAGVLAVSILAFGVTAKLAPARDGNPKAEKQWLSESERAQVGQAVMEKVHTQGLPAVHHEDMIRVSPVVHAPVNLPGYITTDHGETVRLITSFEATPIAGGGLATGGGVGPGGACTCDSQCAAAAGQCRVAHCVGGVCVQENAPVDMRCNHGDGLFCTEDRCNDVGVCIDVRVKPGDAQRLSPCAKHCCLTAACGVGSSFGNCGQPGDCPGTEGCYPKTQAFGGSTYRADCNEALDQCFVEKTTANDVPVGRCCTAGVCTVGITQAACAGQWLRYRDPDDALHACNASLGCPKYSSGIAPDGAHITGIGPIVPPARRCAIGNNLCEINADCITRCNGGANLNQSCDIDGECPGGLCLPIDTCVNDATECSGVGTFTSVGDDYSLSNGSYMRLSEFRFRGGSREPLDVALFEFYDSSFVPARLVNSFAFRFLNAGDFDYNVIIDCSPNCDATQATGTPGEELASDPPFIIPPNGFVVMRATRIGAVLSPHSRQYGEDDGNLFWYSTDVVDVGTNNPNSMWINGVIGNNPATGIDVMSFELLGEKLSNPPLAACCNPLTGACTDRLQWDCAFCTDPARTPCQRGRDCGLNNVFRCSAQDWKGARTRAQVNSDAYRDCSGRYCFNPLNPNPTSLTPCVGVGQGSCISGQTCEAPCEVAACCTPGGCIEVTSAGACTGVGGTLLGFGQKCTPNCCPKPNTGVDCCKDYYNCFAGAVDTGVQCSFRCQNAPSQACTEDFECPSGPCNLPSPDCTGGQICTQVCDGPNNGADPRIHQVNVPTYVDDSTQIVVDFQGITNQAVYFDDCALGGADNGWYEVFTIGKADANDTCAKVTFNFCCSNPIVTPVSRVITRNCPCAGAETIFADENSLGEQAGFGSACNNDFCCTDGNYSIQWTVPAGTYTYGVTSEKTCSHSADTCDVDGDCPVGTWCRRSNSSYQGHIIIKPCAPGACCGSPSDDPVPPFCSVVDKFTCEQERKYCKTNQAACTSAANCPPGDTCLPGVFLGDKEVSPVPLCIGDPCTLGACCIGPGNCADNTGAGITFGACNSQGGVFLGGLRCSENPCPVCPIETADQCQTDVGSQFILPNDRLTGVRRADDFRPTGNLIRRICWYPCFLGVTGDGAGFECSDPGTTPPDAFIAKFYDDDNGKPGLLLPGVPGAGLALTVDAKARSAPGSRCWKYSAPILPPAGLTVPTGDCLWIEVTGLGEAQPGGVCNVLALDSADGNNYSMRDVNNLYELTDFQKSDLAFCIDSGIEGETSPPGSQDGGCGNFPVACCKPGSPTPVCIDGGTYQQCVGTSATPLVGIPFPFITCATVAGMGGCPQPANDNCANAAAPAACVGQSANPNLGICSVSEGPPNISEVCDLTQGSAPRHDCAAAGATCGPVPPASDAYRCGFTTDTRLATTDGPATTGTACFPSGANSFQADTWYTYTAPCSGNMTVHNCGPNKTYDSMLQVFSNDTGTCVACPITANTNNKACSDDNCGTSGSGSAVRIPVTSGACYTIRIGGWSQIGSVSDAGQGISGLDIGVVCNPVVAGDPPQVPSGAQAVHARQKNRYISFMPMNPGQSRAFRVQKAAIANGAGFCTTSGLACTGAPAQGSCAGGQLCVAPFPGGAPAHSCWVQTPVQAGNDINTAKCDATPVFRVWTEPVVNVGDCEIIPNSDYTVFTNTPGPIEVPTGLAIKTAEVASLNTKVWADSVGSFNGVEWTPPNRFTNVQDVLSILARISNAVGAPQFTVVNLQAVSAPDSCLNAFVNTADVLIAVRGVAGDRYGAPDTGKITNTTLCPACP